MTSTAATISTRLFCHPSHALLQAAQDLLPARSQMESRTSVPGWQLQLRRDHTADHRPCMCSHLKGVATHSVSRAQMQLHGAAQTPMCGQNSQHCKHLDSAALLLALHAESHHAILLVPGWSRSQAAPHSWCDAALQLTRHFHVRLALLVAAWAAAAPGGGCAVAASACAAWLATCSSGCSCGQQQRPRRPGLAGTAGAQQACAAQQPLLWHALCFAERVARQGVCQRPWRRRCPWQLALLQAEQMCAQRAPLGSAADLLPGAEDSPQHCAPAKHF